MTKSRLPRTPKFRTQDQRNFRKALLTLAVLYVILTAAIVLTLNYYIP